MGCQEIVLGIAEALVAGTGSREGPGWSCAQRRVPTAFVNPAGRLLGCHPKGSGEPSAFFFESCRPAGGHTGPAPPEQEEGNGGFVQSTAGEELSPQSPWAPSGL